MDGREILHKGMPELPTLLEGVFDRRRFLDYMRGFVVFENDGGGLIVDYIGLAQNLKSALAQYSEGDRKQAGIDEREAVSVMLEKYEVVRDMFHGFDYKKGVSGANKERLYAIASAMEWVQEMHRKAAAKETAEEDKKRAWRRYGDKKKDVDLAVQQIISRAVVSTEIVDILAAAGIETPDISILSDEFLAELKGLKQKNFALEALKKLLNPSLPFSGQKSKNLTFFCYSHFDNMLILL